METTFSKKRIALITATVVVAAFATGVNADDGDLPEATNPDNNSVSIRVPESNDGYWKNTDGVAVMSGNGQCWRTGSWTPDKTISACEGSAAITPVAAADTPPVANPIAANQEIESIAPAAVAAPVILAQTQFDTDRATLTPDGKDALKEVADHAKENNATVVSVGHASSPGSEEHNMALSQRRSLAVREELVNMGVDASQIHAVARGEQEPIADNSTPHGRHLNQRVEIEVIPSSS